MTREHACSGRTLPDLYEFTLEGGWVAVALLEFGDIIEIDDVPRRVTQIKSSLAMGRPGIEGADPTARIRHEPVGTAPPIGANDG